MATVSEPRRETNLPPLKGSIRQAERIVNAQIAAACRLSAVPSGSGHFVSHAEALAAAGHLRR